MFLKLAKRHCVELSRTLLALTVTGRQRHIDVFEQEFEVLLIHFKRIYAMKTVNIVV